MAEEESADIGFEEQLRLEEAEKNRLSNIATGKIKVDEDGTVYDWDDTKKAWFPRVDEDFLARYQLSYGADSIPPPPAQDDPAYAEWYYTYMVDTNSKEYKDWYESMYGPVENSAEDDSEAAKQSDKAENSKNESDESQAGKRKAKDEPPSWYEASEEKNNNVYVSGLPSDVTDEQFLEFMQKCGLIMFDPLNHKPKVKLYKNEDGTTKGDGRCCYIKKESVDLALKILDGYNFNGHTVHVEKAHFEMKGSYDPSKKKRKLTKQEKKKLQEKKEKLFDWRPDKPRGARFKFEKTIVVKNLFTPAELDTNPLLLADIQEDLRNEVEKFGEVKKMIVYDNNPEGVATVMFAEPEQADLCKEALHGRFFAKRQVTAETWDGKTRYKIEESEEEQKKRLERFEHFIEDDSTDEKKAVGGSDGGGTTQPGESGGDGDGTAQPDENEDRAKTPPLKGGDSDDDHLEDEDEESEQAS